VNLVFISLLVLAVNADIRYGISVFVYIALFIAYASILFYGCYFIHSNFFIPVVCSAKTTEKVIAISFDDGPDGAYTTRILNLLKDEDIKAAFFCIGSRIAGKEAILKQAFDEGHLIGNHTFSHHFWFDMFSSKEMLADMRKMDKAMNNVVGKTPRLFRPPYGVTNPNLKKAIIKGNYIPVGWSVRSLDTVIKDERKLFNKVIRQLKPGAVFLFHDTSTATLAILPSFIKHVKSKGYEIIRADKMLNLQPYV
jgi:peptidoglycan/xylan/chitin deacetylase (PgdA/CDA1 family)